MRMRLCFALLTTWLALAAVPVAMGQEFDCDVSIDNSQLQGSEYAYLKELKNEVEEYINDRTWTDDRFLDLERIDCSLSIAFTEAVDQYRYRATLIAVTRRPIYGTTQSTVVVRFKDENWQFNYTQGTPLVFDLNTIDPLTSVLDYYAYVMLGYDYDTFSEFGGTPHFEHARAIAEKARSVGGQGWSELGSDRGRYDLVSQLLGPRLRPLRKAHFEYHYGGLDHFVTDAEEARTTVISVLNSLQTLYQEMSRQYALDLFLSTKSTELAAIFDDSNVSTDAYRILSNLDPANLRTYERLIQ